MNVYNCILLSEFRFQPQTSLPLVGHVHLLSLGHIRPQASPQKMLHNDNNYTGMDKTSLSTSSGSLFVRDSLTLSGCPRHVGRNYVPLLFGVDTIECQLTLLRNT